MIYSPGNQSFDVYVDASFTGDWDPTVADWDSDTARSRTGYVILYANCPVIWASKLQSEIALSTTESEYLAISAATREVLPLMELVQEMQQHGCGLTATTPHLHCRVFEDNSGAVELASASRIENAPTHASHQHKVSSFQKQGSRWYNFNSSSLN
ncbi:hypothetical protein MHU86_1298 [Fragilaria crotonensis]|nr:hypothetical protein MHU86_1298 [Fragilaria crotonensis]